jgi:hypothetical protein
MMGGDLPTSDSFTYGLLTNAEVLDVDQHSDNGREAYRDANIIVWTADDPRRGAKYVGVFNVGDAMQTVDLPWSRIGLPWEGAAVRDLWLHKDSGKATALTVALRPHASVLYRVSQGR